MQEAKFGQTVQYCKTTEDGVMTILPAIITNVSEETPQQADLFVMDRFSQDSYHKSGISFAVNGKRPESWSFL